MTITKEQRAMLDATLPESAVTQRTQAGQSLSYVQGWWVIGELNRIFPAGWSYDVETVEAVRVEEQNPKRPGETRWRVSYRARCVLRVGEVTMADVGHGHGIDRDCGAAIESAEKEAATDALKRAAKSLGWRLGLALYDKDREHVGAEVPPAPTVDAALDARVMRDWDAMPAEELRAAWPSLSADTRSQINAAKAARKAARAAEKAGVQ